MEMQKNNRKEMIGILALSLILVSTYSVSACLPEMLKFYSGYSRASVEMLVSIPSTAMVVMIALSPAISKRIRERVIICTGLCLIGIAGSVPFFVTEYPVVLISRILLGVGIGLVNTRAVSLIGERFEGEQKVRLMGVRMSMEGLGQAGMTYTAGLLLLFGWNRAFLVYLAAFLILLIYLLFVKENSGNNRRKNDTKAELAAGVNAADKKTPVHTRRITAKEWKKILCFVFLNGFSISANSVISLRIPNLIVNMNFGSASDSATVLTLSIIAGFAGGLVFGKMMEILKKHALTVFFGMTAAGYLLIASCVNLTVVTIGALLCGFFIPSILSYGFHFVSECAPTGTLDTANAAALVGCNLGASLAPMILRGIDGINDAAITCFVCYAVMILGLALLNRLTHVFEG